MPTPLDLNQARKARDRKHVQKTIEAEQLRIAKERGWTEQQVRNTFHITPSTPTDPCMEDR